MHKGLTLTPLFSSNIFYKKLEFEDWPSAHSCLDKMLVPYNGSLFEMRYNYDTILPTLGDPINEERNNQQNDGQNTDVKKSQIPNTFYSINYKVNLLMSIMNNDNAGEGESEGDTSKLLLESILEQGDFELEIFESEAIKDLIDFKWDQYGYLVHYFGAGMHLFYIISLTIYIYKTYLTGVYGESEGQHTSKLLLASCIIYPFAYDSVQLYK